jgi:hypothetical protein
MIAVPYSAGLSIFKTRIALKFFISFQFIQPEAVIACSEAIESFSSLN